MVKSSKFIPSKESTEKLKKALKKNPNLLTAENLLASVREDIEEEC